MINSYIAGAFIALQCRLPDIHLLKAVNRPVTKQGRVTIYGPSRRDLRHRIPNSSRRGVVCDLNSANLHQKATREPSRAAFETNCRTDPVPFAV
jgi:hypothetical protein